MRSRWAFSLVLALLLTLLSVPASAQVGDTGLTGTVSDGTGAVLPGVAVTATLTAMNIVRTSVTGVDGRYRFNQIAVGTYVLVFELDGFDTARIESLELNVGQIPTINVTMQVAGVAETITVQAETPIIETTRSELSHTIQGHPGRGASAPRQELAGSRRFGGGSEIRRRRCR